MYRVIIRYYKTILERKIIEDTCRSIPKIADLVYAIEFITMSKLAQVDHMERTDDGCMPKKLVRGNMYGGKVGSKILKNTYNQWV